MSAAMRRRLDRLEAQLAQRGGIDWPMALRRLSDAQLADLERLVTKARDGVDEGEADLTRLDEGERAELATILQAAGADPARTHHQEDL